MATDREVLLDMGFDEARVDLAVKKTGGLQGALQWLEDNQDKPLEEVSREDAPPAQDANGDAADEAGEVPLGAGAEAKSLLCNECGKRFRNADFASYHANKSGHTDFTESEEEIKPLTEEEKKARLDELRAKLTLKRAARNMEDEETKRRNEKIRVKSTREAQDIREDLARQEQIKEAAKKRKEKLEDAEAKKRIRAKIEADKEARRAKAEAEKARREGRPDPTPAPVPAPVQATPQTATAAANQARLRLQTSAGQVVKTLPAETTLTELAQTLAAEKGITVTSFTVSFPRKILDGEALRQTLAEAGLTPSAVLTVQ